MRYRKKEKQLLNEGTCGNYRRRHRLINSDKLWRMIPDGSILHTVGEKTAAQIYGATVGDAVLKTTPPSYLKQVYEARERIVCTNHAHFTHTSSNLTLRKHENNMFTQVSLTEINKHN